LAVPNREFGPDLRRLTKSPPPGTLVFGLLTSYHYRDENLV